MQDGGALPRRKSGHLARSSALGGRSRLPPAPHGVVMPTGRLRRGTAVRGLSKGVVPPLRATRRPRRLTPTRKGCDQVASRAGCLGGVEAKRGLQERHAVAQTPPPCVPATVRLTYMKGAWALSGARPPKQLSLVERLRMREGLLGQPPAGIGLHLGTLLHRAACWRKYSIVQIVT